MNLAGDGALIVLAEIAELLQVPEDVPARIQRALVLLRDVLPFDRCTLVVPDGAGAVLYAVPPPPRAAHDEPVVRLASLLLEEQEAADREHPRAHSHLALPLVAKAREQGVILVERHHDPLYDETDLRLLSIVSCQIGSYLSYCHLVAEQCAQVRERDDLLVAADSAHRTKDEFLAMLGHELRNPLSPILTALQVLRLRGVDGGEHERAIIERQVHRLVRLIDDLLDISRVTSGRIELKKEHLELAEVVGAAVEAASPLLEAKQHRLEVDVAPTGLAVHGDRARLTQVFSNLIVNAGKYTDAHGSITIRARASNGRIAVHVVDNGMGIAPELLPKIFEMFVQDRQGVDRSDGGLGLGLAIVHSLVRLHGGTVEAESRGPALGSSFTVRLEAAAERLSSTALIEPDTSARASNVRVLVVDDGEDAAEMMAALLNVLGYQTRIALDGPQALEVVQTFAPHVGLLDIGLPVMDGYELAKRLLAIPALDGLQLVAITGYGQASDREMARAAGFRAHLVKPVDLALLKSTVANLSPSEPRKNAG